MTDLPVLSNDAAGVDRRLGLLLPPLGFVSTLPVYDDRQPMLDAKTIEAVAKSGDMDGRKKFDSTWIKDQRSHGSCNGFAGASALSRARVRRRCERVDLSGAYLYSLINGGRDQGSMLDDGMRAIQQSGVAPESLVPWNGIYPHLYPPEAHRDAARFKAFECYQVRSAQALFSALALGFDCIVAVHADDGFMRLDRWEVAGGGQGPGNHAVGADGLYWGNGEPVASGFNSWNLSYGNRGRMGLTWSRHFAPTTRYHAFYAIRSTEDDPAAANPPAAQ